MKQNINKAKRVYPGLLKSAIMHAESIVDKGQTIPGMKGDAYDLGQGYAMVRCDTSDIAEKYMDKLESHNMSVNSDYIVPNIIDTFEYRDSIFVVVSNREGGNAHSDDCIYRGMLLFPRGESASMEQVKMHTRNMLGGPDFYAFDSIEIKATGIKDWYCIVTNDETKDFVKGMLTKVDERNFKGSEVIVGGDNEKSYIEIWHISDTPSNRKLLTEVQQGLGDPDNHDDMYIDV